MAMACTLCRAISEASVCTAPARSFLRLHRIDHGGLEKLAGFVHHRHLAAGTNAGIDRQHGQHAGRRREQQVLQILAEHADGFLVGAVLQFQPDLGLDGRVQQPLVGIFDGLFEVRNPLARARGSLC